MTKQRFRGFIAMLEALTGMSEQEMLDKAMQLSREQERKAPKRRILSGDECPENFVGGAQVTVPEVRLMVATMLQMGRSGEDCFEPAKCRICGAQLGDKMQYLAGFEWPEGAEHYINEHDVWTPGLDAFNAALVETYGRLA